MPVDEQIRTALARLTANERECLRRRLIPQTAKEMAVDLGISPHAVEKRLKMARAKLGVSSSLEAARLLARAGGYQQLVPHASDLSERGEVGEVRAVAAVRGRATDHRAAHQGSLMLLLFMFAALVARGVPATEPYRSVMKADDGSDVSARKVGMDEAAAFNREEFARKDADRSGFLDAVEASAMEPRTRYRDPTLPPAPADGGRDPAGERKWMVLLDHDRDGRVDVEEYVRYMMPWTLLSGVPATWRATPH